MQEERQRSSKTKLKEQYKSVFLYAFTYLGFNIHYTDLTRILKEVGYQPPWPDSSLQAIFQRAINLPYVKVPKVVLCSGTKTAADQLPIQPAIRLPFTNAGEMDKLYLEALHTRSWQHGQTTLPFDDWCRQTGITQAIKEGKLHMTYPPRF